MMHWHSVEETGFTLIYQHDDRSPGLHANALGGHDHVLVIAVNPGKGNVIVESERGDLLRHADSGADTVLH